ncbi:hypothetical protein F53441_1930 [Fusarium austroafricanum]|uniref:Rhodopsin domain-containing protein n=1 Tax=Fusarium austroafricanum TaxID=2364996 RepID=A0A8H4P4F1_9HYPO|nr:hypothetical protein F53441_1930 [Fusarium austroafricanum]
MKLRLRDKKDDEPVHTFVNPYAELNAGLWSLFVGASIFLGLRLYVKITRRHGMWYDDYILIVSWIILLANNSLIIYEFGNGYVLKDSSQQWDDRMHILINISSCGTLIGQAWTKTAFAVTLIRMSNQWQKWVLWFCIATMNSYMIVKVFFQWAKVCGKPTYDNWYRFDFCLDPTFRNDFKEGGNIYNIIMDFVFACFPWLITRTLEMKRAEKIGLCLTMSLGMIVAIVSAIRVSWKDQGNGRDAYYIWRNGMSQIWYSSEVAGTIMVQCIPVLRPILRNFQRSYTSRRLDSQTGERKGSGWTWTRSSKHISTGPMTPGHPPIVNTDNVELRNIPEEQEPVEFDFWDKNRVSSSHDVEVGRSQESNLSNDMKFTRDDSWPLGGGSESGRSARSIELAHSNMGLAVEQEAAQQGLSPPPPRRN